MQNLAPQLFEDTPLDMKILSGPMADHWSDWKGDPIYFYEITFASGMTEERYRRRYRQGLPKPPYETTFSEGIPVSIPIFEAQPSEANQERLSALVAIAVANWQQSQQS